MNQATNTTQPVLPTPTPTCLAVTLSGTSVGYAVATRENLLRQGVLNIRKIPSIDGRERRFRQHVTVLLDKCAVTRIAVVRLSGRPAATSPLADIEELWLQAEGARRGLTVTAYASREVRAAFVTGAIRPTTRELAETLAQTFPQLRSKAPSAEPRPDASVLPEFARVPRRLRSERERYWGRMFDAVAGAVHDLDEDLKRRLAEAAV